MANPKMAASSRRFSYRIAVNLDQELLPMGGYVERFDDGNLQETCVMSADWCGPFDDEVAWAQSLYNYVLHRWGAHQELPLG